MLFKQKDKLEVPASNAMLQSTNIWVGDLGAVHCMNNRSGGSNMQKGSGAGAIEAMTSTIHQNCYAQLYMLDDKQMRNIKISMVGAGLGGRFDYTGELKVMKFKEAMNRPNSNKLKEEVKSEKKRMVIQAVWKSLEQKDLPVGAKVITST